MCIAIYKKPGLAKLDKETIKKAMEKNQDWFWLAIKRDWKIILDKGYFELDDMMIANDQVEPGDEVVYHWRYTTHWPTTAKLTHPFIMSKQYKKVTETKAVISKWGILAHNGMMNINNRKTQSDTSTFVKTYSDQLTRYKAETIDKYYWAIISGSRLCIMHTSKTTKFIWSRHEDDDGYMHSNKQIIEPTPRFYGLTGTKYIQSNWWQEMEMIPNTDELQSNRDVEDIHNQYCCDTMESYMDKYNYETTGTVCCEWEIYLKVWDSLIDSNGTMLEEWEAEEIRNNLYWWYY